MASGGDQMVGYGMITFSAAVFVYYTLWIVILPFVETDHAIHSYFLPRIYGITLPIIAGVIALCLIGALVIKIQMKSQKPKEKTN